MAGSGVLLAGLADQLGDVVVSPDVADRAMDVRRLFSCTSSGYHGLPELDGCLLVGGTERRELLPGRFVHARKCRTFIKYRSHDPILRYGLVV